MVVQPQEVLKSRHSTQIRVEAEVEEEAVLVAVQQIRTNSNNRKTSPMEEDVVTLEAGGAKEVVVDGKEAKMQTAMLNAITVVKWVIWLKTAIKSRMTS